MMNLKKISLTIFCPLALLLFSCSNSSGTDVTTLKEAIKMAKIIADNSKEENYASAEVPIIVFAADWCPACRAAEKDLKARNVKYTRANIETNEKAKAAYAQVSQRTGSSGIPQILVGKKAFLGYNWSLLERAINALTKEKSSTSKI